MLRHGVPGHPLAPATLGQVEKTVPIHSGWNFGLKPVFGRRKIPAAAPDQ
jgi:hypothetical protein